MLDLAVSERNYLRADSLYAEVPLGKRADTLQFKWLQALKTRDQRAQDRILSQYRGSTSAAPLIGAYAAIRDFYDPQYFDNLIGAKLRNSGKARNGADGHYVIVGGLAEQGRMAEAAKVISILPGFEYVNQIGRVINVPFYQMPVAQLVQWRDQLLKQDSTPAGDEPQQALVPQIRLYRLAVLSCRLGDYRAAADFAERLRRLPTPAPWTKEIHGLATEVSAQIDVLNNQPEAALVKLNTLDPISPLDIAPVVAFNVPQMMWRAEALFQAHKYNDAMRYLNNMLIAVPYHTPHVAYSLLRRAQINDAQHDYNAARLMYSQFLMLMVKADPQMQPEVRQVRNRLAVLQRLAD